VPAWQSHRYSCRFICGRSGRKCSEQVVTCRSLTACQTMSAIVRKNLFGLVERNSPIRVNQCHPFHQCKGFPDFNFGNLGNSGDSGNVFVQSPVPRGRFADLESLVGNSLSRRAAHVARKSPFVFVRPSGLRRFCLQFHFAHWEHQYGRLQHRVIGNVFFLQYRAEPCTASKMRSAFRCCSRYQPSRDKRRAEIGIISP